MRRSSSLLLAGVLAIGLGGAGLSHTVFGHGASAPTTIATYNVTAGWGDNGGVANIFTPSVADVYVGDTVTWTIGGTEEPHTVSFGPTAMLDQLASNLIVPVAQPAGPPILAFNPKIAFPSMGHAYDGSGYANSGILQGKGKSWSLTFTKPGTYHYRCLIHDIPGRLDQSMSGEVIVHARPAASHLYVVNMGSPNDTITNGSDTFNPRHLTIHAGDSVKWVGSFHTVTFGPDAVRTRLEKTLISPVPQKNGPPLLAFNSQAVFPSGGNVWNGTGFLNSGFLTPKSPTSVPTFTVKFTKPGTYEYDCLIHPNMDGTITVLP